MSKLTYFHPLIILFSIIASVALRVLATILTQSTGYGAFQVYVLADALFVFGVLYGLFHLVRHCWKRRAKEKINIP